MFFKLVRTRADGRMSAYCFSFFFIWWAWLHSISYTRCSRSVKVFMPMDHPVQKKHFWHPFTKYHRELEWRKSCYAYINLTEEPDDLGPGSSALCSTSFVKKTQHQFAYIAKSYKQAVSAHLEVIHIKLGKSLTVACIHYRCLHARYPGDPRQCSTQERCSSPLSGD